MKSLILITSLFISHFAFAEVNPTFICSDEEGKKYDFYTYETGDATQIVITKYGQPVDTIDDITADIFIALEKPTDSKIYSFLKNETEIANITFTVEDGKVLKAGYGSLDSVQLSCSLF